MSSAHPLRAQGSACPKVASPLKCGQTKSGAGGAMGSCSTATAGSERHQCFGLPPAATVAASERTFESSCRSTRSCACKAGWSSSQLCDSCSTRATSLRMAVSLPCRAATCATGPRQRPPGLGRQRPQARRRPAVPLGAPDRLLRREPPLKVP